MRGVKQFDEFLESGVVKKQAKDKSRSRFLIIEAEQGLFLFIRINKKDGC